MANLPQGLPFTHCCLDMFGPFLKSEKRSILKLYGALLNCLASCVIHIEKIKSIDSFILVLTHFIARRGELKSICYDNGTNLIGTKRELAKCTEKLNHQKVGAYLQGRRTESIVWTGPNLDKKFIWLSDTAPSHEILRKVYFLAKPLEKGLNRRW